MKGLKVKRLRKAGLEPALVLTNKVLNLARLPIPPLPQEKEVYRTTANSQPGTGRRAPISPVGRAALRAIPPVERRPLRHQRPPESSGGVPAAGFISILSQTTQPIHTGILQAISFAGYPRCIQRVSVIQHYPSLSAQRYPFATSFLTARVCAEIG